MIRVLVSTLVLIAGNTSLASSTMNRSCEEIAERVGRNFKAGDFNSEIAIALETILRVAVMNLKDRGLITEASQLEDWIGQLSPFSMNSMGAKGVGDHQPWRPEIETIYSFLSSTLGPQLIKELHLDDLHTFNYSAPVAVQPCGDERSGEIWDKAEYETHFVPFMTIIVYWTSRLACQLEAGNYGLEVLCKPATEQVRNATRDFVAPPLGREIFDQTQPRCQR